MECAPVGNGITHSLGVHFNSAERNCFGGNPFVTLYNQTDGRIAAMLTNDTGIVS
jgi:hypothetical protein